VHREVLLELRREGHPASQPDSTRSLVAKAAGMRQTSCMSTTELKAVVDKATQEERLFLQHYLAHLRRQSDPDYAAELSQRMKDMDEGKKVPWSEVKKHLEAE
jgi:hypothetical protein